MSETVKRMLEGTKAASAVQAACFTFIQPPTSGLDKVSNANDAAFSTADVNHFGFPGIGGSDFMNPFEQAFFHHVQTNPVSGLFAAEATIAAQGVNVTTHSLQAPALGVGNNSTQAMASNATNLSFHPMPIPVPGPIAAQAPMLAPVVNTANVSLVTHPTPVPVPARAPLVVTSTCDKVVGKGRICGALG